MRRVSLALVSIILLSLVFGVMSASAQSYGPDLATTSAAIDCGHSASNTSDLAFDENNSTNWLSSQTGAAVSGAACIGQNFGASSYQIQRIGIKQTTTNRILSVIVQNSSNGSSWNTVTTITLTDDASMHYYIVSASAAYQYWRLLANANPSSGQWYVVEIDMMELISWPTNTPGPTDTPTITPTPSTTPSPTPNYFVEITSTAGAPMRVERSATYGDIVITIMLIVTFCTVLAAFGYSFWQRASDGP